MNVRVATIFMSIETLVDVTVGFICENSHSHSLTEVGMLFTMLIKGSTDSGIFQSFKWLWYPCKLCLSANPKHLHKYYVLFTPKR
jgi:hypothetical protein